MKMHSRMPRPLAWLLLSMLSLLALLAAPAGAAVAPATVRIHYHRSAGDYAGWQLYTWYGAASPSPQWNPAQPPTATEPFGEYFDVPVVTTDSGLNFILHDATGNVKNCGADMYFPFPATVAASGAEIWQLQDDCTIYTAEPVAPVGDVHKAKAHFVTRDTIAWPGADPADTYRLYYAAAGGITSGPAGVAGGPSIGLNIDPAGLPAPVLGRFPALTGALSLRIGTGDAALVPALLRGQLVVARFDSGGTLQDATGLQLPGVLDDLYAYDGDLGALPADGQLRFAVWAPTAQKVNLHVYADATGSETAILPMVRDRHGVWRAAGRRSWINSAYYAYEVSAYVVGAGSVLTNVVADPYSLAAAAGNGRSLVVDLRDERTKPRDWDDTARPALAGPQDIVLYELHIRDFSAADHTVPAADRGRYAAFTHADSDGMRHLKALQQAGLTHVHLLPSFEIASVADSGCTASPAIPASAPDSQDQQAALAPVRDQDCFNWGYDPVLYTVPGGSYASDPNGLTRVREFRAMVQALHQAGLRVVMDVVYNHTTASGQAPLSVLDKVVPGYYYRLDANGYVETGSCCQDTAAEHHMMGKLLEDSVLTWARDYRVDGFRFDIMSFHPKPLMVDLKSRLQRIDPTLYMYGEGWNFGAPANNALFVQASQPNMAGTGIGTFNDRMRDAVRGGGPFDGGSALVANQGFINGLWYDANATAGPANAGTLDTLNRDADWIRLGIAGTQRDYVFTDHLGNTVTGAQIDYFGQPAGYAADPPDVINYISAHDNLTLFDNDQLKVPTGTSLADRVRVNSLGLGLVLLSEGVPFFHAGDDLLRSKSLDANSYNGGDWFNVLDFSYQTDNWGVGLPPAWDGNQGNWPVFQPFLADTALRPGYAEITQAGAVFRDFLRIRRSSSLFRLSSGAQVRNCLRFYNVGPSQVPGVIVWALSDPHGGLEGRWRNVAVVANATTSAVSYAVADFQGHQLGLHPVQLGGADPVVKQAAFAPATGTFTVPARTLAVFVERR